jgi:hypothetical protein
MMAVVGQKRNHHDRSYMLPNWITVLLFCKMNRKLRPVTLSVRMVGGVRLQTRVILALSGSPNRQITP